MGGFGIDWYIRTMATINPAQNTHVAFALHLYLVVLNGKLTKYDVTKSSSDNFPTFPRTVLPVRRKKRAVFKVEYLGDILTKSCKTLDYDYL